MKTILIITLTAISIAANAQLFSTVSGNVAYGKNTASGNDVYALCLTTPISENISLGLIGANDGNRWLAGAATINLGKEWKLSDRIGITANIGSGPAINWQTHKPTAYSFFDVGPNYHLNQNISFGGRVLVANVADRSGVDILGVVGFNWKF